MAALADQTYDVQIEKQEVVDDIKAIEEESVSQPKEIEIKDEGKLTLEDSAKSEELIAEPEIKPDYKSDTNIDELRKEEESNKPSDGNVPAADSSDSVETPRQESDISNAPEPVAEGDIEESETIPNESDISEPPSEALEKLAEDPEPEVAKDPTVSESVTGEVTSAEECPHVITSPTSELETGEKLEEPPIVSESATREVTIAEDPSEIAIPLDSTPETGAVTSVEDTPPQVTIPPSPELEKEEKQEEPPVASELVIGEVTNAEELPQVTIPPSREPEKEEKQGEPPVASELVIGEVTSAEEPPQVVIPESSEPEIGEKKEEPQVVPTVTEATPDVVEVDVNLAEATELKETEEQAVVSEFDDASKVESDSTGAEKVEGEELVKQETGVGVAAAESVEEAVNTVKQEAKDGSGKQEETAVVEEPSPSETVKTDAVSEVLTASGAESAEKRQEEGSEGDKTSPMETSRDFVVEAEPGLKAGESEEKQEETVKPDEENAGTTGKDGDANAEREDRKEEAPAKPSHRQSGNIISKVKQSLVKVKKAIIGKSPSSKTVSSEEKDEIKVK